MEQDKTKIHPTLNIFINVVLVIMFSIAVLLIISEVIVPSYFSVISVCAPDDEILDKYDVRVIGVTTVIQKQEAFPGLNNTLTIDNITIGVAPGFDSKEILQHEWCHVDQRQRRGIGTSCKRPTLKLFSEMECYIAEEYPSWIFDTVYNVDTEELMGELNQP